MPGILQEEGHRDSKGTDVGSLREGVRRGGILGKGKEEGVREFEVPVSSPSSFQGFRVHERRQSVLGAKGRKNEIGSGEEGRVDEREDEGTSTGKGTPGTPSCRMEVEGHST